MSDALDRVIAQAEQNAVRTAAPAPPGPPPPPPPVSQTDAPVDPAIADLQASVQELAARVDTLEQARIDDALAEMDGMGDPGMMAALPATTV